MTRNQDASRTVEVGGVPWEITVATVRGFELWFAQVAGFDAPEPIPPIQRPTAEEAAQAAIGHLDRIIGACRARPVVPPDVQQRTDEFCATLAGVPWLEHAGEPSDEFPVVPSLNSAFDEPTHYEYWRPRSMALERAALQTIDDLAIGWIFNRASSGLAGVGQPLHVALWTALDRHAERLGNEHDDVQFEAGVAREALGELLRDVSWAAVEHVIGQPGFFTRLMTIYRKGRWPCGFDAERKRPKVY